MATDPRRLVRVGVLARAHGIRGELLFRPDDPGSRTLLDQRVIVVRDREGRLEERELRFARPAERGLLVMLDGVEDRTQAELLGGREVLLPREALPATEPDEFYVADLVGLQVRTPAGEPLGRVERVVGLGEVPVLEILGAREWQVPLVDTFVKRVDLQAGVVVVEPPVEGEEA